MEFKSVYHYPRGKADWIVRGLPTEPRAAAAERVRALPYFLNNLWPTPRDLWIRYSRRATAGASTHDRAVRLGPNDLVPRPREDGSEPAAVVLNTDGILLGTIDGAHEGKRAREVMHGGPQTIRPDMTHTLAAHLLRGHRYLLVTTAGGNYLGVYAPPRTARA